MTDVDEEPPEMPLYRKDIRMFRAGISLFEFTRLDPDGTLFVKRDEIDKWGMYQHSRMTIYPDEPLFAPFCRQHDLKKPGDSNIFEKKLIDGKWVTLSQPPRYRWAMLMANGELLIKRDHDSRERIGIDKAEYKTLCQEHKLLNPGDHSVVELD